MGPAPLRAASRALLDLLYPPGCPVCGVPCAEDAGDESPTEASPGCAEHRLPAAPAGPRCGRCDGALPAPWPNGDPCADCRRRPLRLARVLALADYGDRGARAWVLALKHGGRRDLAGPLGRALARRLEGAASADARLVPVPLHPWRRLERGHDQAAGLAREVHLAGGPPDRAVLVRTRSTAPQGDPVAPSRAANVHGAFAPRAGRRAAAAVRGREVWLVDDVLTSGSSAEACARVLRRLGARRVSALVVLRASPGPPTLGPAEAGAAWEAGEVGEVRR